jgi:hypothetical protein
MLSRTHTPMAEKHVAVNPREKIVCFGKEESKTLQKAKEHDIDYQRPEPEEHNDAFAGAHYEGADS